MSYQVGPGQTNPLGAQYDGGGTNFALFSANAELVELCLFDASGMEEIQRLKLPTFQDDVHCGYVPGLEPGTLYGYRCHGPFEPKLGHRFNPNKLMLDPYARRLSGELTFHPMHLDYVPGSLASARVMDERDSAPVTPKCVVTVDEPDLPPHKTLRGADETIIYEMHVKGYSQLNEAIAPSSRGTYRAIASDESISYLKSLGVTSVELLPVHASTSEPFLREKGMTNYWGYNNYHFFVMQGNYAEQNALEELRYITQRLHQADIEVIIDVVYNHTAEGGADGPSYSFRGIDNLSYYALDRRDPSVYWNYSGCGNSLDMNHPRVLQLVMDSLRYLAEKVGVDGFRFDLASTLGRCAHTKFFSKHQFFNCIKQDPVLSKLKLIAEPWDLGKEGYQLGNYPDDWHEWNDQFRDVVRRFWRGDHGMAPEFAKRMHGSSDHFNEKGRSPFASVNFVSAHDGFTLHDVVSYENRHNEANMEDNRDGHSHNCSANYGAEGETSDPAINQIRLQQSKNILASLFLAQGTPMLLAGDEFSNSQQGNNNAYCQDNEISWLEWNRFNEEDELFRFCQFLIQLRKRHPLINRPTLPHGLTVSDKTGLTDISWINMDGFEMQANDWKSTGCRSFAMLLAATLDPTDHNSVDTICSLDDAIVIIFNASDKDKKFRFPQKEGHWKIEFNTARQLSDDSQTMLAANEEIEISARSCVMYSYAHDQSSIQG